MVIMDADKDKKEIKAFKKQKNPPVIVSMHLVFDGIMAQ